MFCKHCGRQIEDYARVCRYCGKPVSGLPKQPGPPNRQGQPILPGQQRFSGQQIPCGQPPKKKGKGLIIVLLAVLLALLLGGGGFFLWTQLSGSDKEEKKIEEEEKEPADEDVKGGEGRDKKSPDEDDKEEGDGEDSRKKEEEAEEENGAAAVSEGLSDSDLARQIAKYNTGADSTVSIDVFADRYAPGTRNINYYWNRNLFYTLEDVSPTSSTDGMINGYNITRKILRNAVSGNKMEYEIYSRPSDGRVNKIVSIEYFQNYLEITDYYYDDYGKVSFIFVRSDINYVPSYAVPTKDGQRFYFNSDCMTKWRVVAGGVQTNYCLGQESAEKGGINPSGSVALYSSMAEDGKASYDNMEKQMINAAYNTYHIVLEAEGVSEITGYVYNETGEPVSGAQITLVEEASGDRLYQTQTDSAGLYRIIVPSAEHTYQLAVKRENCVPAAIYGIRVSGQTLSDYQNSVYMVENSGQILPIQVQMYDALNYAANGSGMERLGNAAVYIRDGVNHREGGVVAQGTADGNGCLNVQLPPGMYTAEVKKDGYDTTYYVFAARPGVGEIQINASPRLAAGEVRIVLSWGSRPYDLDSHLFTPYDSVFGDTTYHIWYGNKQDSVGNNLDVDDMDGYGPETMTIPMLKNGLYKYYVADYTNCSGHNPTSCEMSNSGAMVNVYTSNGLTATFAVPASRPGVIWEVFEIRNGAIVPIQRYYSSIDDKTWWHNDK